MIRRAAFRTSAGNIPYSLPVSINSVQPSCGFQEQERDDKKHCGVVQPVHSRYPYGSGRLMTCRRGPSSTNLLLADLDASSRLHSIAPVNWDARATELRRSGEGREHRCDLQNAQSARVRSNPGSGLQYTAPYTCKTYRV